MSPFWGCKTGPAAEATSWAADEEAAAAIAGPAKGRGIADDGIPAAAGGGTGGPPGDNGLLPGGMVLP